MLGCMKPIQINSYSIRVLLAFVLLVGAFALQADRASERAMLTRLVHEIERLEPFIEHAERERDPAAQTVFRYDWLRADLKQVKAGVEAYLVDTDFSPRTHEQLQADYHQ